MTVSSVCDGNLYTGNMVSSYWISLQINLLPPAAHIVVALKHHNLT